jgi:hypothetical protein
LGGGPNEDGSKGSNSEPTGQAEAPPTQRTLVGELQDLHGELERALHPTDLARSDGADADAYAAQFDSWAHAGELAEVPVSDPSWEDAIARELRSVRAENDQMPRDAEAISSMLKDRIGLVFPKQENLEAEIQRRVETQLDSEAGDLDEFEEGGPLQGESLQAGGTTDAGGRPATEDMAATCSRLEHNCEILEAQLSRDPSQFPPELLEAQQDEIRALRQRGERVALPREIRRRLDEIEERMSTAEGVLNEIGEPLQTMESSEENGDIDSRFEESDEEIREMLAELVDLSEKFGESPMAATVDYCGEYAAESYIDEFGSWEKTLEAAQLEPIDEVKRDLRYYSRLDALRSLKKVQHEFGRDPTTGEMDRKGTVPSSKVRLRLGGWNSALELVSSVTDDSLEAPTPTPGSITATDSTTDDSDQSPSDEDAELEDVGIISNVESEMEAATPTPGSTTTTDSATDDSYLSPSDEDAELEDIDILSDIEREMDGL